MNTSKEFQPIFQVNRLTFKIVSRRVAYSQDEVDSLSTQRSPNSDLGEPHHPIAMSVPGK